MSIKKIHTSYVLPTWGGGVRIETASNQSRNVTDVSRQEVVSLTKLGRRGA